MFKGFLGLRVLRLNGNIMAGRLGPKMFAEMKSLEHPTFMSNQVSSVHVDTFSGLYALRELFVSLNPIRALETGTFKGLISLRLLDLSFNRLTTVQRGLFGPDLSNLSERLSLKDNSISSIAPMAFEHLKSLGDKLMLERNHLTVLQPTFGRTFAGLTNLTRLRLRENLLQDVVSDTFLGLDASVTWNLTSTRSAGSPQKPSGAATLCGTYDCTRTKCLH